MSPLIETVIHKIEDGGEGGILIGLVYGKPASLAPQPLKVEAFERWPAADDETPLARPCAICHNLMERPERILLMEPTPTVLLHKPCAVPVGCPRSSVLCS